MYVGDSLYYLQNRELALSTKYSDLLTKEVDTRTGDEIILDIVNRASLLPKRGDE